MRAITVAEPGGPDVLTLADVPAPVPTAGQVLIDVVAAGVNRADLLQRQGHYHPPAGASPILGLECSGRMADGTEVCALLTGGGYAEQVAVPTGQVLAVPGGVDLITAAGLPEVACTVYSNLTMVAALQPGEWVLIHGGSGGIGTFAIQWARAVGARVAVTSGSDEKLARCAELGAELLINYRTQDFAEALRQATGGHGADVILDIMGAKYLSSNLSALASDGRLVVIGLQGGIRAELDLSELLTKRALVAATSLRGRPEVQKAEICRRVAADVWPLIESGQIRPVVDRVLPLAEAPDAHRLMAESGHVGKILLTT